MAVSLEAKVQVVELMEAGLEHARELGLAQVLLYADTDNPASWRTIAVRGRY